jgi:predicted Zn-dependent peptidase
MVQFYMSGASRNFNHAASIFARLFSSIVLEKADIAAERKRIKAEIRESDEKNSLLTFTNGITHKGTSLEGSIVGTNPVIDKITKRRLEEYRKEVFTANNVFVYVTGNFTDDDLSKLSEEIEKYAIEIGVERENFAPVPENFGKRPNEVYIKNADFTMVRFTFDLDMQKLGVPETDLLYDILLSGYASKFFIEMSEDRGLFYDINGALERYRNIGEIYFYYEVKEQDVYEAIKITVDILNGIKKNLLDEASLMKAPYVDNAYNLFDDNREFNFTFAYDRHIMKLPYASLDERIEAYKAVTPERIREAACEIFRPENLTLTLKGKKKKIDSERIENIIEALK